MNTKFHILVKLTLLASCAFLFGCNKEWLEKKSDNSLVIPSKIADYQALLDNKSLMNLQVPALGHLGSDDYYINNDFIDFIQPSQYNAYIWKQNVFPEDQVADWNQSYAQIYSANQALEGASKIERTEANKNQHDNLKGSALFYRSFAFSNLLNLFSVPYSTSSANSDMGIPLKLNSSINDVVGRSTVKDCYDQITNDLLESSKLLPSSQTLNALMRPTKQASFALLSRIYLQLQDYNLSNRFSDSSLFYQNKLINFSTIDSTKSNYAFEATTNPEVILFAQMINYGFYFEDIDSNLYKSYSVDDLRKPLFYQNSGGRIVFKGTYSGVATNLWGGLGTNEVILNKIESLARLGQVNEATTLLNTFLSTRWRPGKYSNVSFSTQDQALSYILNERKKELVSGTTRWIDLRRLNKDDKFKTTLKRVVKGDVFELEPNSSRYTYPIPNSEIKYNPVPQNIRN